MYKKTTLKNGLRVILAPLKDTPTVTVLVLVGTGSKNETKKTNGISHFLEHMCFKGTAKRPKALDIATIMDGVGGEYNAFTSQEYTGFYAKVDSAHQDLVMDVISDIYLNSQFDPQEIAKEKGVIIEEINLYLDQPMRYVGDLFDKLLYGDQPAGWSIAGEKENVLRFKREDFLAYHDAHYSSDNTVVVVAGNIDGQKTLAKIEKFFRSIRVLPVSARPKTKEKQTKPEALVHYKKTDQTHISLGFRTFDIFDERKYALGVMETVLGGGMSSRLFEVLRNQMGVVYYVRSGSQTATDCGYLTTQAGIDNRRVGEVIGAIMKEYRRLKEELVPAGELKKAKDHIKGSTILNLESSDEWASFWGSQEVLLKKIMTPEQIFRKIEAVRAEDVRKIARDFFRPEKLNLALIGPFRGKDKAEFLRILSKF